MKNWFGPAAASAAFVCGLTLTLAIGSAVAPLQEALAFNPGFLGAPQNFGGSDYLNVVCADGVFRWDPSRLPLRVYIDDGTGVPGYRSNFPDMMAKAFDEWSRASKGKLAWRRVNNPRQADIVCVWTPNTKTRYGGVEAGETVTTIRQERNSRRPGVIEAAQITILTQLFGRGFADREIYKTCLHEVGHAIGLQGHSNNPGDIMYPSLNPNQVAYLQDRDVNTIQRLYNGYNQAPTVAQAPSFGSSMPGNGFDGSYAGAQSYAPQYGGPQFGGGTAYGGRSGFGNGFAQSSPYGYAQGFSGRRSGYARARYMDPSRRDAMRRMAWEMAQQIMRQRGY